MIIFYDSYNANQKFNLISWQNRMITWNLKKFRLCEVRASEHFR